MTTPTKPRVSRTKTATKAPEKAASTKTAPKVTLAKKTAQTAAQTPPKAAGVTCAGGRHVFTGKKTKCDCGKKPRLVKQGAPGKVAKAVKAKPAEKTPTSGTTRNGNAAGHRGVWGEFNEHGLRKGSDVAAILDVLLTGASDRQEINDKVAKSITTKTRTGGTKNIPSLVSGVITTMTQQGYKIEASYKLIPPAKGAKTAPKKVTIGKALPKPISKTAKATSTKAPTPVKKTVKAPGATAPRAKKTAAVKSPVTSAKAPVTAKA